VLHAKPGVSYNFRTRDVRAHVVTLDAILVRRVAGTTVLLLIERAPPGRARSGLSG
jgi:hypothetical protein